MRKIPALRSMAMPLALLMTTGAASAQSEESVTIEQLRKELAERDRIIIELMHRTDKLEENLGEKIGNEEVGPPVRVATSRTRQPADVTRSNSGFAIDELAAERALERSLIQQGARLLGPRQVEVSLDSVYTREENDLPTLVSVDDNNFVGEVHQQVDAFDLNIALRLGLPFDSQLEVSVPYRYVDLDEKQTIDSAVQSTTNRSGSGAGDLRVGLVTRLLAERSWRPNLIGRLDWFSGTGKKVDDGLALGGGHEGIGVRLNASWRRDPVVFLLGGGYTGYFDSNAGEVQPGNRLDLSLGAALAVSPETALTFSLHQRFAREFSLDAEALPGTDRQSSVFNISASTILARGVLLHLTAGIGLTEDAPDFQLSVSLPIRVGI